MKYLFICFLIFASCSNNDKEYEGNPTEFEDISFLTTTNENIDGGLINSLKCIIFQRINHSKVNFS